jgi:hypothetical protein
MKTFAEICFGFMLGCMFTVVLILLFGAGCSGPEIKTTSTEWHTLTLDGRELSILKNHINKNVFIRIDMDKVKFKYRLVDTTKCDNNMCELLETKIELVLQEN